MFNIRKPYLNENLLSWENDLEIKQIESDFPTVSIVIPIFNSGKFLEKTLRSLLCNDLTGVELILMDGGSQDDTMKIVEHYQDIFSFIESKPDKGQSDAINKGYQQATGDIFYWLNGDDIILPNTLYEIRKYFKNHSDCHVLVGNAYMTELDFTPINHFVFSTEKLAFSCLIDYAKNHLIQPSVFFSCQAWKQAGTLDIEDHYAMDADLFIGMSKQFKFHYLDLDIAYSVYHEDCKTRKARAESITALALVQAKHGGLKEANNTLKIMVDLYQQLEDKLEKKQAIGSHAKVKLLEAKLETFKNQTAQQKKLLLQLDLEQPS
jgi:glycosyltransferase involved in cell wall biosynthesis